MTMQESVRQCFSKFADFAGRATRSEYWWFALFNFLVSVALSLVHQNLGSLYSLLVLLPSLSVGTRRLHDTGRSGWWQLLWLFPLIGWIALVILLAQAGKEHSQPQGVTV